VQYVKTCVTRVLGRYSFLESSTHAVVKPRLSMSNTSTAGKLLGKRIVDTLYFCSNVSALLLSS
jgi:hypothetical protein